MHDYQVFEQGESLKNAKKALILLHGRGSTAQNILGLAKEFCDDTFYIAAPQATQNTWYPHSFMAEERLNEPWLSSAVEIVKRLLEETEKFIPRKNIYLMGFSQGACLTLEVSARFASQYGGIVAFSGGLIGKTLDISKYHGHFKGTPVFIGNSDTDPHVPLVRSQESQSLMEKMGAKVTLKVYAGMGHTINEDEIQWVRSHLIPGTER